MFWKFKKATVKSASRIPIVEQLKRTRIVVIDDVASEFPFDILRGFGYSIDHWKDVEDLQKLETGFYDIIILDIGGIGQYLDPQKEGLAVLERIKKVNPAQVVVANSGQSYDPDKIPFFRLADQFVPKPATAMLWKDTLDDLLRNKLTPDYYWNSIRTMLHDQGVSERAILKLESKLLKGQVKPTDYPTFIRNTLGHIDNIATVSTTIGKVLTLCGL